MGIIRPYTSQQREEIINGAIRERYRQDCYSVTTCIQPQYPNIREKEKRKIYLRNSDPKLRN